MKLTIGYLYGDLMNIYGDTGNIIALKKRAEWRDINTQVINISINDTIKPKEIDIFFFGGGQDQSQKEVSADLIKSDKAEIIRQEIDRGVPLLSICGGYQLLGEYYQPFNEPKLLGISLFPAYTQASHDRMIGNIIVQTGRGGNENGEKSMHDTFPSKQLPSTLLVGFENHSGKTYLREGATPLGKVLKGCGNNGEDKTEGCVYKNAIGCYMHGSLLPKNPQLTDWLLKKTLETKYENEISLESLDDTIEITAHKKIIDKLGV